MHAWISRLVLCGLAVVCLGWSATAATSPTTVTLDNGLRVIIQEAPESPLVTVGVWVRAGSSRETAETNGSAHMLEHLLFKGTTRRAAGELDEAIEALGSQLKANTSRDWMQIRATVPTAWWKEALDVVADAVQNAALRDADFEREQMVVLDELAREQNDPVRVATRAAWEAMYPTHPYRFPEGGTRVSVLGLTAESVREFYRQWYVPNNAAVVVVGNVASADAVAAVTAQFAGWKPAGAVPPFARMDNPPAAPVRTDLTGRLPVTVMVVGVMGPAMSDPKDVLAMDSLLFLLTGKGGVLNERLVNERRLARVIDGDFLTQRDRSLFTVSVALAPDADPKQVEDEVLAAFTRAAAEPPTAADLTRARRELIGTWLFDIETTEGLAHNLGFYESLSALPFGIAYEENVMALTPEEIRHAAETYLDPNRRVTVVVQGVRPVAPQAPPSPAGADQRKARVAEVGR